MNFKQSVESNTKLYSNDEYKEMSNKEKIELFNKTAHLFIDRVNSFGISILYQNERVLFKPTIESNISFKIKNLPNNVFAMISQNESKNVFYINKKHINNGPRMNNAIIHETAHLIQHALTSLEYLYSEKSQEYQYLSILKSTSLSPDFKRNLFGFEVKDRVYINYEKVSGIVTIDNLIFSFYTISLPERYAK